MSLRLCKLWAPVLQRPPRAHASARACTCARANSLGRTLRRIQATGCMGDTEIASRSPSAFDLLPVSITTADGRMGRMGRVSPVWCFQPGRRRAVYNACRLGGDVGSCW